MVLILLSLLASAAASSHKDAKATAHISSRDPNWVSNAIEEADIKCVQSKCASTMASCASAHKVCAERVQCAEDGNERSPAECWAGVRWTDLHPNELKIWNCATDNDCMPKGAGSSLLQMATERAGPAALFTPMTAESLMEVENQMRTHGKQSAEEKREAHEHARREAMKAELMGRFDSLSDSMKHHLVAMATQQHHLDHARDTLNKFHGLMGSVTGEHTDAAAMFDKLKEMQAGLGALGDQLDKHIMTPSKAEFMSIQATASPFKLPKAVELWEKDQQKIATH